MGIKKVVKKRKGIIEDFDFNKIVSAVNKSASRVGKVLSNDELHNIRVEVHKLLHDETTDVERIHQVVEISLSKVDMEVADSYRSYRNYKKDMDKSMDGTYEKVTEAMGERDRSNSNLNSYLFSSRRVSASNILLSDMFEKFFLTQSEYIAAREGMIYYHDKNNRMVFMHNCSVFRMADVLEDGFWMNGYFCKEPKNIKVAIGALMDTFLTMCNSQYGGGTISDIDIVLDKYCQKTVQWYKDKGLSGEQAVKFTRDDLRDGIKALEFRLNSIESSRGDYPFTTISFGRSVSYWGREITKTILEVREKGHGDKVRQTAIFPKLVFIVRKDKANEDLFDLAIRVSSKCMYPDYIPEDMVSPMGCRSFMEDSYDLEGNKIMSGKGNIGVISLNLPMIFMKAKTDGRDFFDVLKVYIDMVRDVHYRTYEAIGKQKAKSNPLAFTQGGLLGGYLNPDDPISPLVNAYFTASFGITALNELSILATGKTIAEDQSFAIKVVKAIKYRVEFWRTVDNRLYSLYGTPAETLATRQCGQFKEKYGIIKGVSDKSYFTNSFHCDVTEDITPFDKQDKEEELFKLINGGHIQYVRVNPDNLSGIKDIVLRGIDKGFYQGVNVNACTCEDCGHQWNDDGGNPCPKCNSNNVTELNRICGYIGFSRKKNDRTIHDGKMEEIRERVSM